MSGETVHPRVAVVSANPIRGDQSNGILMRSLFRNWPPGQLSQIYFPVAITHLPDQTVCSEYRLIYPWRSVRQISCRIANADSPTVLQGGASTGNPRPRLNKVVGWIRRQKWLMRYFRLGIEAWGSNMLGGVLERQLRELKPDCVYALIGNYWQTKIITQACERLDIPLFMHVTDDFVSSLYQDLPFSARMQAASERWFRRAVALSSGLAAISPVMAETYANRYGGDWTWFTTLTDASDYDPSQRHEDGVIRLVYSGNLELERWQVLRKLAGALQSLQKEQGITIQLAIYAPPDQLQAYGKALTEYSVTELKGWVKPQELPGIFHATDILVHVESFVPSVADYTRLSFSTKLSQYMMSGRAILAVGPAELGSIQMVHRADAGLTICSDDQTTFQRELTPLLTSAARRAAYAKNGQHWASEWFESRGGRERFRQEIVSAAHRNKTPIASSTLHQAELR